VAPWADGVTAVLVRTPSVEFARAWAIQRELAELRRAGQIPDIVWLLEHPPVFTYGRHASLDDLHLSEGEVEALGAAVYQIDRGGQMTWHGPGQTTGYVIADLRARRQRLRDFVALLIEAMRSASGIPNAACDPGRPGLYVEGRKLGSVGVRVEGGVTTHGFALNREPDLSWFARMTACGASEVSATSVLAEGGNPDRDRVESALAEALDAIPTSVPAVSRLLAPATG
jgi:lipoyl(octanoyl) transferase